MKLTTARHGLAAAGQREPFGWPQQILDGNRMAIWTRRRCLYCPARMAIRIWHRLRSFTGHGTI